MSGNITHCNDNFCVIDNFLPSEIFHEVHESVKREKFFYENSLEWNTVWHPLNGNSLITGLKSFGETGMPSLRYPTGAPIDRFIETIEKSKHEFEHLLLPTEPEDDSLKFTAAGFLYRAGWGLPWHIDHGNLSYRGAFAYYLHENWRGNWGGELMISPEPRRYSPQKGDIDLGFRQGVGFVEPAHISEGIGTFIMPKPNRIVFLKQGILHAINAVSPLAGENMRFSIAGFFIK
jgi:hypothetical protein